MSDRNLKQLDRYCARSATKVTLTGKPSNRAERRKFQHVLNREHVKADEIDQDALFAAIKERGTK